MGLMITALKAIEYTYRSFLVNIQFCVYTQRRVKMLLDRLKLYLGF